MKIFSSARFRLTIWYSLTIALISLLFSLTIYQIQTAELTRFEELQRQRIESRLNNSAPLRGELQLVLDQELITDVKSRLLTRLGIVNGVIIVISTSLAYFLAGKTLAPIEEMVSEQHRFISDASHELRTPLTAIRTGLEVYLRGKKTLTSANTLIKENLEEVVRLQTLSDSLLTLSSTDQDNSTHEQLYLDQLIRSAIKRLSPIAKTKRIKLTTKLAKAQVMGNADQLTQLFTILLDNAIKYTGKGGKISISLRPQGKYLEFGLKDTGIGISTHDLKHVFDRFYRADSARSRGGQGLGLAIARQISDSHNAKIRVVSKVGKGTDFQLTFRSVS